MAQLSEFPQVLQQSDEVKKQAKRRRLIRNVLIPWLFILPLLIIHIFVVAIPAVQGVFMSLTDWTGMNEPSYIGLENYRVLFFEDKKFAASLMNNIIWMAFFLTVPFILALFCSSVLAQVKRFAMVYRSIMFIPYVLASVVTATIWRNLLSPRKGIGSALANVGIEGFDIPWLGRSETALMSIAFIDNWHFWGLLDDPLPGSHAIDPAGAL